MREKIQAFFKNLGLFQTAISAYQLVQAWPGITLENEGAVRLWFQAWIPIGRALAETTDTKSDDKTIDGAAAILDDDCAWIFFWKLIAAGKNLKVAGAPDSLPGNENPDVQLSLSWLLNFWAWLQQLILLIREDHDASK